MAPGRRKGPAKAAAAASADSGHKWNVGDLVLAKMKGFPAWPAQVSDPQEWGFSSVRKKVLVHFYGTKQIAFCNHIDLEAFTEDKKKLLPSRRHGKGADFVRAVDEIIDAYECVKNKTKDEVYLREPSKIKLDSNSRTTEDIQPECLYSSTECSHAHSEEILGASDEGGLHKACKLDEEQTEAALCVVDRLRETNLTSTKSRMKLREPFLHSCSMQTNMTSLRRSSNSHNDDHAKLEKPLTESSSLGLLFVDVEIAAAQEKPALGDSKLPINADCSNMSSDVPAHQVSPRKTDDVKYDVGGLECEDFMTGKTSSKRKNYHFSCADKLNGSLNISVKTVVSKKKRKPNRKRVISGRVCSKMDEEVELQEDQRGDNPGPLNLYEEALKMPQKTDGDEHLPLVKRARVRMQKLQIVEADSEEVISKNNDKDTGIVNNADKDAISFNIYDAKQPHLEVGVSSSSTHTEDCTLRNHQISWKDRKYQFNGCNLDDEAALPPSKRLLRALRAMSANVTERCDDCAETLKERDSVPSGCMDAPKEDPNKLLTNGRARHPLPPDSEHDLEEGSNNILICERIENPTFFADTSSDCGVPPKTLMVSNFISSTPGAVAKIKSDAFHSSKICSPDDVKCDGHNSKMVDSDTYIHHDSDSLSAFDKQANSTTSEDVLDTSSSSTVTEYRMNSILDPIIETDESAGALSKHKKLDSIPKLEVLNDFGTAKDVCVVPPVGNVAILSGMTSRSADLHDINCGSRVTLDTVKDVRIKVSPKDAGFSTEMTPMKVLILEAQEKRRISRSMSFTDTDAKDISYTAVRPPLCHRDNCTEESSPTNNKIYHKTLSCGRNNLLNKGVLQGDILDKESNKLRGLDEAGAARKSFEAILCILSRTKESISRATRLAIDCAKYGIAQEVIEILLHNLENEPNLYRRVDLFFLVDSITQCSHSQRGVASDIYPSLVQAVLPRLLSAAAPSGNAANENRRQCLKVLRVWLERKLLPESIIRYHMKELDLVRENSFCGILSRRSSRTERALDDPVREMEGMLVDEYGSNTGFPLPGLLSSSVLEEDEEGITCEEKKYAAAAPGWNSVCFPKETVEGSATIKRRHILEDVDGELEMEDVAPSYEVDDRSCNSAAEVSSMGSHHKFKQHISFPSAPPLPEDKPPSPPPLPSSPPPLGSNRCIPKLASVIPLSHSDAAEMPHSDVKIGKPNKHSYSDIQKLICHNSRQISPEAVSYGVSGHCVTQKQMPPPASPFSSSGSYGNASFSHHSINGRVHSQPSMNSTSPSVEYHHQPPRRFFSNQFSDIRNDHQGVQSWENGSLSKVFQFATENCNEHLYDEESTKVHVKHNIRERGGCPLTIFHGPFSSKIEVSSASLSYVPSSEQSSVPFRGCSATPSTSGYHSASRSSDQISQVPKAPGHWRPR